MLANYPMSALLLIHNTHIHNCLYLRVHDIVHFLGIRNHFCRYLSNKVEER